MDEIAYAPYRDPEEFIVEWTDRIWVSRGIGLIRENYAPDAIVHGAYGTSHGVEPVIRGTLMKIAAYPGRIGQAEDVVWEARGTDAFLSSHRIYSTGTHTGMSGYGPPTHRSFTSRAIANCLYRRGVMVEEWVVRDEYAIVEQLGLDPFAVARELAFSDWDAPHPPVSDVLSSGDSGARPDLHRAECEQVLGLVDTVWNQRLLHQVTEFVARDVTCHISRERTVTRPDGYQLGLLDLLSPMPDAQFEVRDIVAHDSPAHGGVRVGVVWWLTGTYSGAPTYGPSTGSPVRILGSSQFLFRDGRIVREWRVYDELSILAQVSKQRGDEPLGTAPSE
ncbi:putative ester cyclase [Tamaricihabitans halophyticus]|uniref:Putative ester cyclase n=1 Tax=Tamaricihabitans halophyticus TaxID=1262583 RepID=A0A4R2Q8D9_9PSEU|nr:ester cyclase [Tamaricihabitans halophyticus]TCP45087.1 putative ester cyclase [Tamaricihabitans halophyticus]